jgi:hypothetical protein
MGRRAGRLLTIGLFPAVVASAALTVSLFGAFFGVPLLALVGRPWWRAQRAARGRPTRPAPVHTVIAVGTLTLGLLVGAAVGLDDFDSPVEAAVVALTLALAAACWAGTIELLRSGPAPTTREIRGVRPARPAAT